MTDIRHVVINPITPNTAPRRFRLAPDVPARSDGLGGWQEVTRERRTSLTEYIGVAVPKLTLPLLLDGFPHTSIEADLTWLLRLGERVGTQSPVFKVTGPVYLSGQAFVMGAAPTFGAFDRRISDGQLTRQAITLTLWKYVAADTIVSSSAQRHKATKGSTNHPKTYTVKSGDTLQKIAARFYGKASAWHEIATANGIRDPNHLKVGQVLKLP